MKSPFDTDIGRRFYAKHRRKLFLAQAVVFVVIGVVIAGMLWRSPGESKSPGTPASVTPTGAAETLWTCSMHPQIRKLQPGKCPLCGMDLIPVVRTAGGMRTLALSPESRALMSIETSLVERKYVTHQIPMVGRVDYDETRLGYITAWVAGRLDRLYVDYTGIDVKKGDHLVSIYSEQLYSAQTELIQGLRNRPERPPATTLIRPIDLVASAREKLRLLGMNEEQIADIEQRNEPSDHMTIYSDMSGVVIEKLKQQGERVQLGERIYTIADLSQVWVHLDAYESDLLWVHYGQDVTITTEAYPGEEFHGRIAFVQRFLNDKTRTVKVRVNVPNQDGKLKPEMFVHAVVRPQVAAGGKVMDLSLAGKWISPMHPEIIRDEPGNCPICGMPLERAESLGYVTPETDPLGPPLVIPYSAALVTGTRAIVYVQLPNMPSFAEPALLTLSVIVQEGDMEKIREAFATYADMLKRPYDQPGTEFARRSWDEYAQALVQQARDGQRVDSAEQAEDVLAKVEMAMSEAREKFAPLNRPTFEGREIVLGPRAGDYYLVRNGVEEGELVVTQGNFKIDAEIQIQAKPSMMTPEGGGGGGHQHGGQSAPVAQKTGDEHAGHAMALPADFNRQIRDLEAAYQHVAQAVEQEDVAAAASAFVSFAQALDAVDGSLLTGHPRMLWKEFDMLLGNDVVEGRDARQLADVERAFELLKGNMRRMREEMGIMPIDETHIERIAVAPEFEAELARVWEQYRDVGQALAADNMQEARQFLATLESAVATVDDSTLGDRARVVWSQERSNLEKSIGNLKKAQDMEAIRIQFLPLSQEIGVMAKTFALGEATPVFELHCPMAFEGKGAIWYQDDDQVRNPYFGAKMPECADRVEKLSVESREAMGASAAHQHD